jgi:hypothetical protein
LAYVTDDETVGFYSNTATFKFTSSPTIKIQGLSNTGEEGVSPINNHKYDYVGVYTNEGDASEKVYSYRFDIYNRDNTLLVSSGDLLHNSLNDELPTESVDEWTTRQGLQPGY